MWANSSCSGRRIRWRNGRWWRPNEDNLTPLQKQTVDILPNGQEAKLHIAMKYPTDNYFRAWGRTQDDKSDEVELSQRKYRVKIELRGIGVNEKYSYWVIHENGVLKIRKH